MTVDNRFFIGIGSQRAGSTLLHRILDRCSSIFMHPVKELHYFDTLYDIRHPSVLREYSENQIENLNSLVVNSKKKECLFRTNNILATRRVENIDYIDLYRPCLMDNKIIGEITPEYMILPDAGIEQMAKIVGKDALIVLLTRDPVQRFISSFKLLKAYNNTSPDFDNFERDILEIFDKMPTWVIQQRALSQYADCVDNYNKHFTSVLTLSYENLTSRNPDTQAIEISNLEEYIGEKLSSPELNKVLDTRVNQITSVSAVSNKTLSRLEEILQ